MAVIRLATLVALLATVAVMPQAQAGAPTAPGLLEVRGQAGASLLLRLPRPVVVSTEGAFGDLEVDQNPDVTLKGRGRVIGVVLTRSTAAGARPAKEPATWSVLQYGMCAGRGCVPVAEPVVVSVAYGDGVEAAQGAEVRLPAGNYQLHVVTDGAPVTARVRFRGLNGSRSVVARGRSPQTVYEALPDPTGERFTSRDVVRLGGRGYSVISRLVRHEQAATVNGGHCIVALDDDPENDPPDPAVDPDPATGCASRLPGTAAAVAEGREPTGYHGNTGNRGVLLGGSLPAGNVVFRSSFDAGRFRTTQDVHASRLMTERSFIALWVGWV